MMIAIVCKPHLFADLQLRQQKDDPHIPAVPIYTDSDQMTDILAFYDSNLLNLYLHRRDDHEALKHWLDAIQAAPDESRHKPLNIK